MEFPNKEETFTLLRNSTITCIKNLLRQSVASGLKNRLRFDKFLCLSDSFHIFHNKPLWANAIYDLGIMYCKVATPSFFIAFAS